ncbi:MAG TPA: hypothetical protein VEQ59_18030, partial [Polyangiaceae bacterium]|nr:hypothetical protein [Polyangiaceae bacterium]
TTDVPSLQELRPDLPPALVYIVERCMARDPSQRFANVAELAEALSPLDAWNPQSDAERIRRRLDAAHDDGREISELRPAASGRRGTNGAVAPLPGPSRARRFFTVLVACLVLVPILLLLPAVARAPGLAPARAFTAQAVYSTQQAWQKLRQRAHELWMKEADDSSRPGQRP